jgi:hypothetical protein
VAHLIDITLLSFPKCFLFAEFDTFYTRPNLKNVMIAPRPNWRRKAMPATPALQIP